MAQCLLLRPDNSCHGCVEVRVVVDPLAGMHQDLILDELLPEHPDARVSKSRICQGDLKLDRHVISRIFDQLPSLVHDLLERLCKEVEGEAAMHDKGVAIDIHLEHLQPGEGRKEHLRASLIAARHTGDENDRLGPAARRCVVCTPRTRAHIGSASSAMRHGRPFPVASRTQSTPAPERSAWLAPCRLSWRRSRTRRRPSRRARQGL
eukprot:3466322-Prymnesium_polylepis.1